MADTDTYTLSAAEARRLRRGAFLPILLILPMAAMFGLDASKSQPMHFLMTFTVASGISAVVVSISWSGAKRRIAEFSQTTLTINDGKIVWMIGSRRTELSLNEVTKIDVQELRGNVRTITLIRAGGARTMLEGYERMNDLLDRLCQHTDAELTRASRWMVL